MPVTESGVVARVFWLRSTVLTVTLARQLIQMYYEFLLAARIASTASMSSCVAMIGAEALSTSAMRTTAHNDSR